MFNIYKKETDLQTDNSRRSLLLKNIFVLVILIACGNSLSAQSLIPELVFMNPKLKTGPGSKPAGKDGAVYIFSNVGVGVDAILTIQGRSSMQVTLADIDMKGPDQDPAQGTGYDNAWQPRVSFANGQAPAHSSWWMEFKVSFVNHEHPEQAVPVNQFFVSGLDIDGDGRSLHEYQSYYKIHDFSLEQNTQMTFYAVKGCLDDPREEGRRFDGTVRDYAGITTDANEAAVDNFYRNTSSLVVRVGAETGNSGSDETNRMYALWFKSLAYGVPENAPVPLTLVAFDAQADDNRDVHLSWSTAMEQNLSHFSVERSLDGNEFQDGALIFTDERRMVRKEYHFTDHPEVAGSQVVYYRLKMVDRDKKFRYSDVIRVRIHQTGQTSVAANALEQVRNKLLSPAYLPAAGPINGF